MNYHRPLGKVHSRPKRTAGRNAPRPEPVILCKRPVPVAGASEATVVYSGTDPTSQYLVTVRTGTAKMRREFFKRVNRYGLACEHIGADEQAETTKDKDGNDRSRFQFVHSEFLVWGRLSQLEEFVRLNTGSGKPIQSYTDVIPVRVVSATGSGPADSATTQKRIRDMMRPGKLQRDREEKDAREQREILNRIPSGNPESPHYTEREGYARGVACRLAPTFFPNASPGARDALTAHLATFILRKDRIPQTEDEFREWLLKNA